MRTIIYIVIFFLSYTSLYSQRWSNVGFTGGYKVNTLLNDNISNDESISAKIGFNPTIGIEYGININEFLQLSLTGSYARTNVSLLYETPDSNLNFTTKRKLLFNSLSAGLTLRYFIPNGYYLEGGAAYVFLPSVLEKDDNSLFESNSNEFVKGYVEINGGIGMLAYKSYRTNLMIGIKGSLGLTDFLSAKGKEVNYPTFKNYESNSSNRFVSVMFVVNLIYDVGILNSSRQTYRYPFFKK